MLNRFLAGRNGADHISLTAMIVALILSFIPVTTPVLLIISLVIMAYGLFRVLSKNIYKRRSENDKFRAFFRPVTRKISGMYYKLKRRSKDGKIYRFYACPSCKQKVRVPKGKGKISITCPKCQTKFVKKT